MLRDSYMNDRDNRDALHEIEMAALSKYSFESFYAMGTLGSMDGSDSSVAVLVQGLRSKDPYVRHAAAEALAELGVHALPAKDALIEVIQMHEREGAAEYAAESLGNMGEATGDVLGVLEKSMQSSNSVLARKSKVAYFKLVEESKEVETAP
jgi:HEAT repeat protein